MIKRFVILSLICSIFITSCKKKPSALAAVKKSGPVEAEGFIVEPHVESENVEVPGTLLPVEETQIRPEVTGRIVVLNIKKERL